MAEVFQYPMEFPGWFIDYFNYLLLCINAVVLAGVWVFFFRYGKFNYGIDFGCLWKSTLMIALTVAAIAGYMVPTTKFKAKHQEAGDKIILDGEKLIYTPRKGKFKDFEPQEIKEFNFRDIVRIYKEPVTFNPPPKYFVVAQTGGARDSIFVTKNLPGFEKMLGELSGLSNVPFER